MHHDAGIAITIAHLELAVMVLGVGTMAAHLNPRRGPIPALALCDNANAVAWHRRAGARCSKASELIRMLGELEMEYKIFLNARHLAGIDNEVADKISRESWEDVIKFMKGGGAVIKEDVVKKERLNYGLTKSSWMYSDVPQEL